MSRRVAAVPFAERRPALGEAGRAIEHVGSTSVTRLAAEPATDVVLDVDRAPAAERTAYERLTLEPTERFPDDGEAHQDGKAALIGEILAQS